MARVMSLVCAVLIVALYAFAGCAHADSKTRPAQGDSTKSYDVYKGHADSVMALAVNPVDPNEFVSGGRDVSDRDRGVYRLWDFASGKQVMSVVNLIGTPICLNYSFDGRYLLVGQDNYYDKFEGALRYVSRWALYDARRGRCIKVVERGQFMEPFSLAFSPDGKMFTVAGTGKNVDIWNMDPDPDKVAIKRTLIGHASHVTSVGWATDSNRLVTASMDGTLRVWDLSKPDPFVRALTGHAHSVNAAAWSMDGSFIASGSSDYTVRIWDPNSGLLKQTLQGHTGAVNCVLITPDSRLVISAGMDKTIRIWDPVEGRCLQVISDHDGPIQAMALSADGKVLFTGSDDKTIRSWVVGLHGKGKR